MRLASLRARVTATFTLAIALLLGIVCGGLTLYFQREAYAQADTTLEQALRLLRNELLEHPALAGADDLDAVRQLLTDTRQDLTESGVAVLILPQHGRALTGGTGRRISPVAAWRLRRGRVGQYAVVVALPWTEKAAQLRNRAWVLLLLSAVAVGATGLGAWFLVGRTLSPIDRLAQQAQEAAQSGSGTLHLSPPSDDAEVVNLVATLNGFLDHIARATAAKGRFYAAASHELRTPLQVLSGRLELALSRPRTTDEYQATLTELQLQTDRLSSLVQDLLLLHRLDSAGASDRPALAGETVDMVALVHSVAATLAPLAAQRGLTVDIAAPETAIVIAPPTYAQMVVSNLLTNAVKYATPHSTVRASLTAGGDGVRFHLFNRADAVNTHAKAGEGLFALQPFYRADPSRNSKTGGNGLGLSICKAITDAQGWRLELQPETTGVGKGVGATVVFPSHP